MQMKKILGILLAFCFVMSVTAATATQVWHKIIIIIGVKNKKDSTKITTGTTSKNSKSYIRW